LSEQSQQRIEQEVSFPNSASKAEFNINQALKAYLAPEQLDGTRLIRRTLLTTYSATDVWRSADAKELARCYEKRASEDYHRSDTTASLPCTQPVETSSALLAHPDKKHVILPILQPHSLQYIPAP